MLAVFLILAIQLFKNSKAETQFNHFNTVAVKLDPGVLWILAISILHI